MRIAIGVVAVIAALLLFAPDSWAHGGQFRGPGDSVPPGLREPSDPTPPPPPPPSGPPTTPTPTTPTPVTPATPTTPTTPGATPPTTPAPTTQPNNRGRQTPQSFEDWTFWYHNNNDDIENLKHHLYYLSGSDNPIFRTGDERGGGQRDAATRMTAKKVQEVVIPALLWAMDPKNSKHQDTESASYIALAKVTRDPEHIQLIMQGLDRDAKHDLIVQESTALALGLLRRGDPSDQFTAREIDKVREFLFGVFENADYQARTRGFAAIALGLLGDQPAGSGEFTSDAGGAQRAITERLFALLEEKYSNQDLYVGLMMAIGLQPAPSLSQDHRDVLTECALKGRLFRENASALVRSYAALALGRIGTTADIKTLDNVLMARRGMDHNIRRSAAIGLGTLGRLVSGNDRVEVAKTLMRSIERVKDNSTVNFGIISLAYLLIEDLKSNSTDVIGNTEVEQYLIDTAQKGTYMHRPFAALALSLVLREISDDVEIDDYQEFKEKALKTLREGLADARMDKKGLAAFCTALGIAKDGRSKEVLRQFVADRKEDKMLRGYAALALGLIGQRPQEIVKAIADALQERSSEELRRQAAVALGLLGNPKIPGTGKDAIGLLIKELEEAKTQSHKGQIVLALARIGDHRALDALVGLLQNKDEKDLTRALACAGLGLIGDLEWLPSLARGSKNVNYRASTDLMNEYLSIL